MTVWQIIVSAAVVLILLIVAYRAGQSEGELNQRVRALMSPTPDKAARDYFEGELRKAHARGDSWMRMYSAQRAECQKLNKAITNRNRRIAALRKRSSAETQPNE